MAGIGNQNAHTGDSVFENVYVYGKLYYDFTGDDLQLPENLTVKNLTVLENSWFGGIATFKDDVYIEGKLDLFELLVRHRLDVGVGGTVFTGINTGPFPGRVGVGNTAPFERFQVGGPNTIGNSGETDDRAVVITGLGTVGIGTTAPANFVGMNTGFTGEVKLDVLGPMRLDGHLYDSGQSPGVNGYYLNMDLDGVRWIQASPVEQVGILVQDEGVYIPNPGTAQTFSVMNYVQLNSLGLGTDTIIPIPDPDNPTMIARIQSQDLWGFTTSGDVNSPIYRMTNVGIKNDSPAVELDVTGELHVTGNVDFDSQLNVDGATFLNDILDVDGKTDLRNDLEVHQNTLLSGTLDVTGVARFNNVADASSSTQGGSVTIDGGTAIAKKLYVGSELHVTGGAYLDSTLDVDGLTTFNDTTDASTTTNASVQMDGGVGIVKKLFVGGQTKLLANVSSTSKDTGALVVESGGVGIEENLNVGGVAKIGSNQSSTSKDTGALIVELGGVGVEENVNVGGNVRIGVNESSTNKDTGALVVEQGGVGIQENLNVGNNTRLEGTLELENAFIDKLNSVGFDVSKSKNDYRLSAVGAGVSWRPSGVETENAIWVTVDGDDANTGFLEGDAKRTVGGAAAIAKEGDTIIIRSGSYTENNPIGLRTDVSVSGEDLRLVTIVPENRDKDVFHVRRGCLIQNLNFSGPPDDGQGGVSYNHTGAAVAFPPLVVADQANTGYIALGPANEGATGRWKSPYVRNCTNFMTGSTGMRIDGNHANADFSGTNNLGQDFKSFVCDAFTQYNQNGIGVSITNNAYAQLVSIFTIASDIAIYCDTGGQCDLTNSNSSFGNFGLFADGVGATEFTGEVFTSAPADSDVIELTNLTDSLGRFRKPFDGQGLFFKLNLANYLDTTVSGILDKPLQLIRGITVVNGGLPGEYNSAAPPVITVPRPLGPESIGAEFSVNVSAAGTITSVDVVASGRNFLPNQDFTVSVSGGGSAQLVADTDPILYTVSVAGEPSNVGLTTVTFDQFIPYEIFAGTDIELVRLSRIITSSHSFEYIGAGTDINKANPFQGGEPITANEVIAINGGQVPFTSTDQKGNFRIGDGLTVDQTTSTIRGRDFNRAIQAQLTPLILALR